MERGTGDGVLSAQPRSQGGHQSASSSTEAESKAEFGTDMAMVWSIQEAVACQTQQIGVSSCGATAVVDVLKALGVTGAGPELVDGCVRTRLRRNDSPLPDYLHSRSEAGTST